MELQRIEKEKEIARLRAQQERAKDKQAEKVVTFVWCISITEKMVWYSVDALSVLYVLYCSHICIRNVYTIFYYNFTNMYRMLWELNVIKRRWSETGENQKEKILSRSEFCFRLCNQLCVCIQSNHCMKVQKSTNFSEKNLLIDEKL